MNSPKFLSLFLMAILAIPTLSSPTTTQNTNTNVSISQNPNQNRQNPYDAKHQNKFHRYNKPRGIRFACDRFPKVCLAKGSPGPFCCKKKCVSLRGDRSNCGYCGKKCKYYETCCEGRCVNTRFDLFNCGRCGHICKRGSSCAYGMCDYAY